MSWAEVTAERAGTADVGVVGIGVMGSNLVLNLLSKGFTVAFYNRELDIGENFHTEHAPKFDAGKLLGSASYEDFAKLLKKPRKALILVTAGKPTDMVIESLMGAFEKEDIIVDTGNAHFKDQSQRAEMVEAAGMRFLGMGISGGAEGARKGPAFFPGGTLSIWEDIKHIVEAASAKASDGRPCVTMCGKGGAGSCVKMYHNAGEYAVLQIWGEAYAALRSTGLTGEEVKAVLKGWKQRGALDSYMLDITIEVAGKTDPEAADASALVEHTADKIGSKGTGLWSVQVALEVGCPVPSLAQAVLARQMSMTRAERQKNCGLIGSVVGAAPVSAPAGEERDKLVEDLYWAVYLSIVASYAQMFQALRIVDKEYGLEIIGNLPRIISTFRAGCILQGAMLEPMTKAFEADPDIPNLVCAFKEEIKAGMPGFRAACARLCLGAEPALVMQASLGYLVTMSQQTLQAAQVVALQRDVFGRHGFNRLRDDGTATEELHHVDWPEMIP